MKPEAERTIPVEDVVWGAESIAEVIGTTRRKAFYLLEKGYLPATKIGERWCASRAALKNRVASADHKTTA